MDPLDDPGFVRSCLEEAMDHEGIPRHDELPEEAAAVAVVLHMGEGSPAMIWIRRAEHPKDPWSGQMGFPGGRRDPGDASSRDTAERETREEIGLDLGELGEHLGTLHPLPAKNRRLGKPVFRIDPHVYWVPTLPELVPDPREVDATHSIPLVDLVDPELATTTTYDWEGLVLELPGIDWEGRLLWGLSYQILQDLLSRLRETRLGEVLAQ